MDLESRFSTLAAQPMSVFAHEVFDSKQAATWKIASVLGMCSRWGLPNLLHMHYSPLRMILFRPICRCTSDVQACPGRMPPARQTVLNPVLYLCLCFSCGLVSLTDRHTSKQPRFSILNTVHDMSDNLFGKVNQMFCSVLRTVLTVFRPD